MDPVSGAMIGDVLLKQPLGEHASGTIWAGLDRKRAREVSLKLASPSALKLDPTLVERFHLESRAIREIKSPHVVIVYGDGVTATGLPWIMMERLDGEWLATRLERAAQLPLDDVERLVDQIGNGLSAAHAVGLVHRDVQPTSIFLMADTPHARVNIVDFGWAKVIGGNLTDPKLTLHGKLMGTPAYLSPERCSSKRAAPHDDMWALSVLAYRFLTGVLPFDSPKLGELLVKIVQRKYEPASGLRVGLSSAIDDFFACAFGAEPSDRYASVVDLVTAFSTAMAST